MRRSIVIACVWWIGACITFDASNDPLKFGMTKDEVMQAAQAPLIYLSGPRGSEKYKIERLATVPGLYPVDTRVVLQFRRGRLTGWRHDWNMHPPWY
jgi:hypothetical protein